MKNTVIAFAQDHARGLLRGIRTPLDIANTVAAMRGADGHLAAALYALEVASLVPDSMEAQLRIVIGEALESQPPIIPPVLPGHSMSQTSGAVTLENYTLDDSGNGTFIPPGTYSVDRVSVKDRNAYKINQGPFKGRVINIP